MGCQRWPLHACSVFDASFTGASDFWWPHTILLKLLHKSTGIRLKASASAGGSTSATGRPARLLQSARSRSLQIQSRKGSSGAGVPPPCNSFANPIQTYYSLLRAFTLHALARRARLNRVLPAHRCMFSLAKCVTTCAVTGTRER